MLIFAGISISMIAGDNGILNKAIEAKEKAEKAEKNEKTILSNYEDIINEYETGITVEQVTDSNPEVLEGTGTDATTRVEGIDIKNVKTKPLY